jgi:Glycosyltransferase family 87
MGRPSTMGLRVGIALAGAALFLMVLGIAVYTRPEAADFGALYTGGLIVRQGRAPKLYDLNEQTRVQESLFKRKGLLLYAYPPVVAVLFAPLTRLSYRSAYVVCGALNVLLWVVFLVVLRREMGMGRKLSADFLILSSLFCPLWIALIQGQVSVFVLVIFALTFVRLRRSQSYSPGFVLGLGLLKFQDVLPFALIFLLRRKWRFVTGFAATGFVLGFLSLAAVGARGAISYVALLTDIVMHPTRGLYATIRPSNMPTVRAFVTALSPRTLSERWISVVAMALSVGLLLTIARLWNREERRGNRASFNLMFAAALTSSLVVSPHLNAHDLTPMLLAFVLTISSPQWEVRCAERVILAVASAIFYAAPLYFILAGRGELYLLAPVLATFALASVSLARRGVDRIHGGTPGPLAPEVSAMAEH